ncbi:hypothetical protein [Paraburkholderia adhaesiva]|uniref:hypothetical protein n=1 Tax=Paraburkholderia adhaesiva TaxID=2883244 RepID=UPI001F306638|nr:hypothetical protein [Paraburkholderia adhaesiva]
MLFPFVMCPQPSLRMQPYLADLPRSVQAPYRSGTPTLNGVCPFAPEDYLKPRAGNLMSGALPLADNRFTARFIPVFRVGGESAIPGWQTETATRKNHQAAGTWLTLPIQFWHACLATNDFPFLSRSVYLLFLARIGTDGVVRSRNARQR